MRHTLWIEPAGKRWALKAQCGNSVLNFGDFRWHWLATLVGVMQIDGTLTT